MRDMNRECTYNEYLAIMRSSIIEDSKLHRFQFDFIETNQNEMQEDEDETEPTLPNWSPDSVETFLRSEFFEKKAKEKYTEM